MDILEEKKGETVVFALKGRLDSATSPEVETKIINSIKIGAKDIILNFSSLDYISSAGIRVLVHCHKELEKNRGHILLASVPKPIENVLYITGFLPYFKVFDNQAQALDAVAKNKD
ncbi:MAG: putative anti-sigma factor antagonist BtrV [Chlamydiales bacterium]|nr:putative anti-sigma factor antagonist BtrV [Chlamydiales bacterium]